MMFAAAAADAATAAYAVTARAAHNAAALDALPSAKITFLSFACRGDAADLQPNACDSPVQRTLVYSRDNGDEYRSWNSL